MHNKRKFLSLFEVIVTSCNGNLKLYIQIKNPFSLRSIKNNAEILCLQQEGICQLEKAFLFSG